MNPIIDESGTKRWHNEAGQFHRTDGPAIIYANGEQHWYFNDKLHRTDGPAIIWPNGDQFWYFNGEYHRTDGPAYMSADGYQSYYIHGNPLTEEQYYDITQSEEHLNWYLLQL